MAVLSDRIDKARLAQGVLPYLLSVGLVAAATIVLFSVASLSLLGTSKEKLTGYRIGVSPVEDKFISAVVSYPDSNAALVSVEKLSSSSEANNLPSSTPVSPPSGMSREESGAEPAFELPADGETSAPAVQTPHGSMRGPSTDETPSPELTASQEVIAQPLPMADETGAAAVEPPLGSTQSPSIDETLPPELSGSQVIAQRLSIADEASGAQYASGATMPVLATSDKERDEIFRDFEIQRNHHATLDEGSAVLRENAPAQHFRNRRLDDRLLGLNATLRYRVRKECGPIHDHALYHHCVATFSAYRQ